jgi:hypothetical protein
MALFNLSKNANFYQFFFGENVSEIITLVPVKEILLSLSYSVMARLTQRSLALVEVHIRPCFVTLASDTV